MKVRDRGHQGSQVVTEPGRDHRQSWTPKEPREAETTTSPENTGLPKLLGGEAVCFASCYILPADQRFLGPGLGGPSFCPRPELPQAKPLNPFRSHQGGREARWERPVELQEHPPHSGQPLLPWARCHARH